MEAGVVAIYQTCPHLGCRVPGCATSQWFECPCHGSQYNQVGEKKGGPAPRGMDRFPMTVSGGVLTVDTGTIIPGPTIGTNTTGQEAEGPIASGRPEAGTERRQDRPLRPGCGYASDHRSTAAQCLRGPIDRKTPLVTFFASTNTPR